MDIGIPVETRENGRRVAARPPIQTFQLAHSDPPKPLKSPSQEYRSACTGLVISEHFLPKNDFVEIGGVNPFKSLPFDEVHEGWWTAANYLRACVRGAYSMRRRLRNLILIQTNSVMNLRVSAQFVQLLAKHGSLGRSREIVNFEGLAR
jgi:hypothetical protein